MGKGRGEGGRKGCFCGVMANADYRLGRRRRVKWIRVD